MHAQTLTSPPSRPGRGVILVIALAAGVAVTLFALVTVAVIAYSKRTVTLSGRVILTDTDPTTTKFTWDAKPPTCTGEGDFGDVGEGAQVVISEPGGKAIAAGSLKAGKPGGIREDVDGQIATSCTFAASVTGVPVRDLYRVQVGRQPAVTVSSVEGLTIRFGG